MTIESKTTRDNIKQRVFELIMEMHVDPAIELEEKMDLQDDLEFDSLDVVELVLNIEKEFEIMMPDYDIWEFRKIEQYINQIEKTINAN